MRQNFHLWFAHLNSALISIIVQNLIEQIWEAFRENLANGDWGCLVLQLLESFIVLSSHDVSILIHRQLWKSLVQLHEGVVRIGKYSDCKSFQVSNVFKKQLSRVLPENVILVMEKTLLDHLCLVLFVQKLQNLVCIAHAKCLRLLQIVHKVEVECFASISD